MGFQGVGIANREVSQLCLSDLSPLSIGLRSLVAWCQRGADMSIRVDRHGGATAQTTAHAKAQSHHDDLQSPAVAAGAPCCQVNGFTPRPPKSLLYNCPCAAQSFDRFCCLQALGRMPQLLGKTPTRKSTSPPDVAPTLTFGLVSTMEWAFKRWRPPLPTLDCPTSTLPDHAINLG